MLIFLNFVCKSDTPSVKLFAPLTLATFSHWRRLLLDELFTIIYYFSIIYSKIILVTTEKRLHLSLLQWEKVDATTEQTDEVYFLTIM